MSEPREEQDLVRDHEYDGIREYDNRLPNWWLYTLYGTIVFAVLYWGFYHTWGFGALPHEQYVQEMAEAAELQLARMDGKELSNESLKLMAAVPERVDRGRAIFTQFCIVCHEADGSGKIGPNLTDRYWLHGSQPLEIYHTVTTGVPEKGMAAWGPQLGPARVEDVVAFVMTLKGKNLPGKAPEGELATEESTMSGSQDAAL